MKRTTKTTVAETPVSAATLVETANPDQPAAARQEPNGAAKDGLDDYTPSKPSTSVLDDYDLDDFRAGPFVPIEEDADKGVPEVPVRPPKKTEVVFLHPAWEAELLLLPSEFQKYETHLVHKRVADKHRDLIRPAQVFVYTTSTGEFCLWPIKLQDQTGKISDWSHNALRQIHKARAAGKWCRFVPNQKLQTYHLKFTKEQPKHPEWPEGELRFLIDVAFRDRKILDEKHPILVPLMEEDEAN